MSSSGRSNSWDDNAIKVFKSLKLNYDLDLMEQLRARYISSDLKAGKEAVEEFIRKEVELWKN